MRLMNIKTNQLETFDNWDTVPPYAILSHAWEEGEVVFHDISADVAKKKRGWNKILGACAEAEKLGIFYVWVDTCCIFKESSAELSESINSMFAWYRDARVCFAYMGDFGENESKAVFDTSKWWTRGWTLQELIAPTEVMFFTKDWSFVGLRTPLASRIAEITGIAKEVLSGGSLVNLHNFSVAQKFSWAAKRKTTRGEDRAYSLMGLFGVNMSMIYGEGEQAAFFRLQKEIFGVYADHSIFAWHHPSWTSQEMDTHDLLAPSVSAFESSSNIISEPYNWDIVGRPKESKVKLISNKPLANFSTFSHGIRVQLLVENLEKNRFLAHLACRFREKSATCLAFELVLEQGSLQYRRNSPIGLREVILDNYLHYKLTVKDVYIAQPRQDFTLSLRPVRYQIESSSILPTPETSLYLMEDAVYKAGFTPVTYSPPVEYWARPGSVPHIRLSPELRLWNHDKDSAVVYRNEETGDSFAVIIATSQKFRSKPQRFLVGLVDNISPDTSGDAVVDEFFKDKSHLLTDLSTQMLVKLLRSGKQVILSVNVVREQADTFTAVALQNFRLWIVVKEPRM